MRNRLIVIRGNSGSGKSALASAIRASRPEHTVAIIRQDVVRREILHSRDVAGGPAIGLIDMMARYALLNGRDVVVEGILGAHRYADMLRTLVLDHDGPTGCYFYDVCFAETLRRHATKPNADEFGEAEMRDWWHGLDLIDDLGEKILEESLSLEDATTRIVTDMWQPESLEEETGWL